MNSDTFLGYYRAKSVVIPGGTGFFGTHLQEALKDTGCETQVPRRADGIDLRRFEDCVSYIGKAKPDIIINCAANQGGIGYYKGRQADVFEDNILMNMNLMKAAAQAGVSKFINIVPNCAYPGYTEWDELKEEDFWNGEVHESIFAYGFPRKASVAYGKALRLQTGFDVIPLAVANMYGPGEHFNPSQSKALAGMMKKFHDAKRDGASCVEIWGTGKPLRDWLYVKDGAEGVLRAGAVYDDPELLNIATGTGISVKDLAETIASVVGYKGELHYDTSRQDGALKKISSVIKMKEKLNWAPSTPLSQGIRETYEWFKENYDAAIAY